MGADRLAVLDFLSICGYNPGAGQAIRQRGNHQVGHAPRVRACLISSERKRFALERRMEERLT
jgi:hypothetical protein